MSAAGAGVTVTRRQPQVDPRMRDRWVAARRAEGRRRLRVLLGFLAVVAVLLGGWGILHTPLFAIAHVRVTGARHEPLTLIEQDLGARRGRPLVDVNVAAGEARLAALPWVRQASARRQWPGTLVVQVTERRAVAQVAAAGSRPRLVLVDATGRVLQVVSSPAAGLPTLTGAGPLPGPGGTLRSAMAGTGGSVGTPALLALSSLLPRPLAGEVSALHASNGMISAVVMAKAATQGAAPAATGSARPVTVDFGDGTQLAAKAQALATIVTQVNLSQVTKIDLSVPGRPLLTGSPQPTNFSTTAGG